MPDKPALGALLETRSVMPPGAWENDQGPEDWYAVCNDEGIVAYFADSTDAFRFRLSEINRALSG